MKETVFTGYIKAPIADSDYLFGEPQFTYGEMLVADRNWRPWLPAGELQIRNGVETTNCTAFGTTNLVEMLLARKSGRKDKRNYSDRALGIMSGTTQTSGNNPHFVLETARKRGLVEEAKMPFVEKDYYRPAPVSFSTALEAIRWKQENTMKHEWVFAEQGGMWDALAFSPLGVAVDAWHEDGKYYVRENKNDNHWATIVGGVKGKEWWAYDSYIPFLKKLPWHYGFDRVKRIHIEPNTEPKNKIKDMLEAIFSNYI